MINRFSPLCRLIYRWALLRPLWAYFFLAILNTFVILGFLFSSARAQATATPPTPGAGTELAPGGWQPSSDSYPGPGVNATSTPTQPAGAPTPVPTIFRPSPTSEVALTATPSLPVPTFPSLTPELTLPAPVITSTTGLTATATLIPLPELTLVFPEKRAAALLVTATPESASPLPPWTQPQRLVPLALIGLIWVILGGWFYYSQREL